MSFDVHTSAVWKKKRADFAGVFENGLNGIAVVNTIATSQRVRVALVNVLAPSNAARGISPAPLWHPLMPHATSQ